ncbi:hypothetical protein GTX23_13750, partial [Streptomyces sp. SID6139]|nr:hypothetical protein [Streptomyces sp. SID6139]
ALTVRRLHRLCRGDLRLLRSLVAALVAGEDLVAVPGTGERAWRGPLPVTPAVRDRLAPVLERAAPGGREILERLAFAEPARLPLYDLDLDVLEGLEAAGLIAVDDAGGVALADPLHGPALRAVTGRLRARRLSRAGADRGAALAAEQRLLEGRLAQLDVRPVATPVGDWAVAEGEPVPAGYAAVRARFARLGGAVRDAAAWAREGLRWAPGNAGCAAELALAQAESDESGQ